MPNNDTDRCKAASFDDLNVGDEVFWHGQYRRIDHRDVDTIGPYYRLEQIDRGIAATRLRRTDGHFTVKVKDDPGAEFAKVNVGDEVTIEIVDDSAGTYTVTGKVWMFFDSKAVGQFIFWREDAPEKFYSGHKLVSHKPKDPEWWEWRHVWWDDHYYTLISDYHIHRSWVCGCGDRNVRDLNHNTSVRNADVKKATFSHE